MAEIGSLVVKLQAETAQFTEQMAKAESNLGGLKDKAGEAGAGIGVSMEKSRGGLMIVEEMTGVRLPRALNRLIAGIPGVGAAFSTMLPLLGVVAAIAIIGKLIQKHIEAAAAARELGNIESEAATKSASALTSLGDKLLQAGIKSDELAKNHVGALSKQLELLDHQSLQELMDTFEKFGAEADTIFAKIKANTSFWEVWKSGSAGAKAALGDFKTQYDALLAKGDQAGASALLKGTLNSAEKLQQAQITYNELIGKQVRTQQEAKDIHEAVQLMYDDGIKSDSAGLAVQQASVQALRDQVTAEGLIAQAKQQNAANVKTEDGQKDAAAAKEKAAKAAHELAEADRQEAALQNATATGVEQHSQALIRLARSKAEASSAATKGGEDDGADDKLADQKKLIEQERDFDIQAAQVALAAKKVAYDSDIKEASLTAKQKETLAQDWANEQQRTADEIVQFNADANTKIVAADRAADNERAASDRSLAAKEMSEQLSLAEFTAQISLKADEQAAKNKLALHQATAKQTLAADIAASQADTAAEVTALQAQLMALDTHDKKYLEAVVKFNADVTKAEQKGAADVTALRSAAEQKQLMDTQNAENKMKEAISSDIASSIVMNKSLAASFRQTGEQMAEQMIKNLLMMELTGDKEKLINAKAAYGRAFKAMSGIPPAPIWGFAAGAAAFAAVMSFEVGGKIPGEGAVPILGHGGETVVTKALTDRVESSENGGSKGGGMPSITYAPQVHAVDATGVDAMLSKHASVFQRHITAAVRRMNK